mmetsp:Transcript_153144/g.267589  ORF Transcript_153144/g.267589 Transcript_153144/m.267589 type:complete len:81 (+) Transcript_153144:400-642(+)
MNSVKALQLYCIVQDMQVGNMVADRTWMHCKTSRSLVGAAGGASPATPCFPTLLKHHEDHEINSCRRTTHSSWRYCSHSL